MSLEMWLSRHDPKLPDGSPDWLPDSGRSLDRGASVVLGHRFDALQPSFALRSQVAMQLMR